MEKPTVAVVGLGVVGGAVYKALQAAGYNTLGYSRSNPINSYEQIAKEAKIVFLVVGTPSQPDGKVNMDAVYDVMENIENQFAPIPDDDNDEEVQKDPLTDLIERPIIVIKSTVVPGTNAMLKKLYPQYTFVSSPEFLTEMTALQDFQNPDRTVIGCDSDEVFEKIAAIYDDIEETGGDKITAPVLHMTPIEAELVKYFSNNFLALKVTYANEAKEICEIYGADWNGKVATAVGMDHRIGDSHFEVTEKGGFGGMCFPKDTKGLYNELLLRGYTPQLLKTAIELNEKFRSKKGRDPYTNLDN